MRKKSHWRLAKYLMRENHRPAIAMMFKIGSIAPDFMVRSMIQGHSYDTTLPRVKRRLEMLEASGRWNLHTGSAMLRIIWLIILRLRIIIMEILTSGRIVYLRNSSFRCCGSIWTINGGRIKITENIRI